MRAGSAVCATLFAMRLVTIALVALQAPSPAGPLLRNEDPELVRADLRSMTARTYERRAGKLVEVAREVRTYDANGHVKRDEKRKPDGSVVVAYDYAWNANGQLVSRTYRDATNRTESRTFTYTLDGNGRVAQRIMRDPTAPT